MQINRNRGQIANATALFARQSCAKAWILMQRCQAMLPLRNSHIRRRAIKVAAGIEHNRAEIRGEEAP
jgi:hypothetical protein